MQSPDKKNIINALEERGSVEEAYEVVDFLGKSLEGQTMLGEMIDRDVYLLETNDEVARTMSPVQSDFIFYECPYISLK